MTEHTIVVLGEAWGRDEDTYKRPFMGATGRELNRLCEEAGLLPAGSTVQMGFHNIGRDQIYSRANIHLTNVFNFRPPGNRIEDLCGPRHGSRAALRPGKYLRAEYYPELARLEAELAALRPNLILGLGATALWFLLDTTAITKMRGTTLTTPYGKALATFHPAYLMRGKWRLRPVVIFDLIKAAREREYAEVRRPARTAFIAESLDDIEQLTPWIANARVVSIDIETFADQITCIGFAWSATDALVIPIFDQRKTNRCYWPAEIEPLVWRAIRRLCELPVAKVFQNGIYDLHFLWRRYGIRTRNCVHDTMLLSHALYPEVQKGLGFLGSVYTDEAAWKVMRPRHSKTLKREDD
jgi:uracil-DNA glycosylase